MKQKILTTSASAAAFAGAIVSPLLDAEFEPSLSAATPPLYVCVRGGEGDLTWAEGYWEGFEMNKKKIMRGQPTYQ